MITPMHQLLTLFPTLSDSLDTSTVRIIVGQSKEAFTLHKGILCNVAPYFRAALEGHFRESVEQVLEMPEEDPTVFRSFQLWVYTKSILEEGENLDAVAWRLLIDLYIFGDRYDIPILQDEAIDLLIDKRDAFNKIPASHFGYVYHNTPERSPLRKLCVDWSAHGIRPYLWFEKGIRHWYPKKFLIDLITAKYEPEKDTTIEPMDFGSRRSEYHVKSTKSAKDINIDE